MLGLEEIVGLELISSDAKVIGTVEGAGLDLPAWKVRALRIGLRRGMEEVVGSKRKLFGVNKVFISTVELSSVSDAVIMSRPASAMVEMLQPDGEHLTPAGGFMGMRVICSNAAFVGHIDNIFIDPVQGWSIPYIQVKLDREAIDQLSLHRSFMASSLIPISTADVDTIGEMVILKITMSELKARLSHQHKTSSGGNSPT
jgi:sporulation protein YlmC with PRC-barrel domain